MAGLRRDRVHAEPAEKKEGRRDVGLPFGLMLAEKLSGMDLRNFSAVSASFAGSA